MNEKLNDLAARSFKSKRAAAEGAELLCAEFSERRDCAFAAEYLGRFHWSVCLRFFESVGLSGSEAEKIASAWRRGGKSGYAAEFAFCRGLLEGGFDSKIAVGFAAKTLANGQSRNGFYAALVSEFEKIFDSEELRKKFSELSGIAGGEIVGRFIEGARRVPEKTDGGEVEELRRELSEARAQIADLNARLEQAFRMDETNRSSELITLKANVSEALREEYREFQTAGRTFNEDNFAANSASLFRVFKILKRFGFSLE